MLTFPLLFASGFMSIFSVVIAFFKDIPDVKGDRRSSIQTLSVRLGVRGVVAAARCCTAQAACVSELMRRRQPDAAGPFGSRAPRRSKPC